MDTAPKKRAGQFAKGGDPRINRLGRPAGQTPLSDVLRKAVAEKKNGKTVRETVGRIIVDMALKRDRWALQFLFERIEGKVKDVVDMNHGLQPQKPVAEMTDDELGAIIARAKPVQPCPPD